MTSLVVVLEAEEPATLPPYLGRASHAVFLKGGGAAGSRPGGAAACAGRAAALHVLVAGGRADGAGQRGAGWTAKSVGVWLPKAAQDALRRRYKLGRPPRAGRDWQPNLARPFPRSRRLRARRAQSGVLPDWPLGWVLVAMEELA